MDFMELIQKRYSVRAYMPEPVAEDLLEKVLEAARLAPTGANKQPFRLIVIHSTDRENELLQIFNRTWFATAPIVICVCAVMSAAWTRPYDGLNVGMIDAAIITDHITLAAADLGLGTCWIANFNPVVAREILGLPEGVDPIMFTPLGFPADEPRPKIRKPLTDLVRYEKW